MSGQSAQLSTSEACSMQERIQHPASQAAYGKQGKKGSGGGKRVPTKYGSAGSKQSHQG